MNATAEKTRVAVLSSASGGGAGIAAMRLCEALNHDNSVSAEFIDGVAMGGKLPLDVAPQTSMSNRTISDTHFTVEYPGYSRGWLIDLLCGYDLVNVHWASFLVSLAELHSVAASGTPLLFTLHDFHYITGGCHYPATCKKLASGCVSCPQVDTAHVNPLLIQRNLGIKQEIFSFPNVHLSAPSKYLRDQAVATGIIPENRAHVLRNAYQPMLPPDVPEPSTKIRILLIADSLVEGRKQMALAIQSLAELARQNAQHALGLEFTLDVVGHVDEQLRGLLGTVDMPHVAHGRIADHAHLSRILLQSDLMLTCSNEDNWPNILIEAGAYGCKPIVGPGHGCEEFVHTYRFGHVAEDYTVAAFVGAAIAAVEERSRSQALRALTEIRNDHTPKQIAERYLELLRTIRTSAL